MRIFRILIISVLLASKAFSQTAAIKLAQAYQTLVNDAQAKYALTSLCVLDAATGKIIFAKNENVGVATASTLKTITSATAFSVLGKNFKYETSLVYTGKISPDGTLKGDIIIIGVGDPTLGSWRYEQTKENMVLNKFVTAIKNAGIKKIEGCIIGDDSLFGTQTMPEGWVWQDMGNYYGAGTSALAWRENQFDIHLKPGEAVGTAVKMTKQAPLMPYLKIVNELKTGPSGSGDDAYGFLPPFGEVAYLRGTWGVGINKSSISLALPDPAYDAAFRLQDTLKRLNVTVGKQATTHRRLSLENNYETEPTTKLTSVLSPSLSEIIYWFNKKSVNLYGEQLLKTIALKLGKAATTKGGSESVVNFWAAKGIDKNALNILDGSGLSPGTRVTTLAMANILFQAQKENWYDDYLNSFPDNNGMKLKSGTINDVLAYAGYFTDRSGKKYIAVININNYNGSGIKNKLFNVLNALK